MSFKIGDKVKTKYGKGKIVEIAGDDCGNLVFHEDWSGGHNGNYFARGMYSGKHCWWFNDKGLTLIESKSFTKSDLKDGDICTLRNGDKEIFADGNSIKFDIDNFNDDLTDIDCDKKFDIVKVERPIKYETVFEREEEPTEMTIEEIEEKLGLEKGTLRVKGVNE